MRPRSEAPGETDAARARGDAGTALVSAWFTLPVVIAFLLLATQVAFALYTATMVEAIAFDAAYEVASSDVRDNRAAAQVAAQLEADARAPGLDIRWEWVATDHDYVELAFVVENPTFLPDALAGGLGFGSTRRSVRVRVEEPRP